MNAARLRERKPCLGTWMSFGSSVVAELAAQCGFDWLLIDLEHGCGSEAAVLPQLQALRGTNTVGIVRVGAPHADLIARVLDWGADGIMVPHVSTAAEAEACVLAAHYAPRGKRGLSRSVRAHGYGLRPVRTEPPLIFAQIENIEGVENVRSISEVDGIDVLFVGPADLRFDLEARAAKATRDYDACLGEVTAAGKPCGILLRDPAEANKLRSLGFTHIACDTDVGILRTGYQAIISKLSNP